MLIKTFKDSYPVQYLLLIIIAGAVWAGAFVHPQLDLEGINRLLAPGNAALRFLTFGIPWLSVLIAFAIALFSALLLNYVLIKNNLVDKNSLVPALVLTVLYGHSASHVALNQAIIAGFFMILALNNVLAVYSEEQAYEKVFNAGFFISLASFFYFPAIFLLVFVWFSFIVFSLYQWREWVISVIGLITPYLFLWVWFFWNDELDVAMLSYQSFFSQFSGVKFTSPDGFLNVAVTLLIALFFLWALFNVLVKLDERPIAVRKRYWAVFWMFAITFANLFIAGDFSDSTVFLLMIPVAVFIAVAVGEVRRIWIVELLFALLATLIVINNMTLPV